MLFGISPLQCLYASVPAGRHKGKQTDRQAGELAGGQECLPVRKSENGQAGNYVFFTCVAAFGAVVAFLSRISDLENTLPLHPSGRAKPKARTADPGSVLLLGSRKVSGDRCLING